MDISEDGDSAASLDNVFWCTKSCNSFWLSWLQELCSSACSYAGQCHRLPGPLQDACVVGQALLAPAACRLWFVSVSSNRERDSIGRRGLEPAKPNSQFSEAEKWEVTKAGLLLPREVMLVALMGCPAFLRAAPHCWRPCPGADATAAQAE